ncbi:MAG: tetratricopeptide repeat protein [Gemmatimonadetes bacterium]|nr:tetratricopeptide repeat protein [Gemmatimonadota bacterium]NIQ53379.1 tetratricopeptide repeat protein [Gemmatimonadota bacterium]NIU73522.1 tetratricopeptide repeat protein [Gammaproteobacteria bacterium]NIX43731.1 tetratricopeptide repeat protein [Gemmatimonadota bacterium]NIY07924.1 tetratricopeptide repeat protein [Gemmatimonadota bacterium]
MQAGFAHRAGRRENGTAEPDPREARNLGIAFFQTAMLEEAEREFRRILDGDPDDVRARHYLALIALRRGEADVAEEQLRSLMDTVGPRTGIRLNLAYALRLQRRFLDALALLAEAREHAPDDPRVRLAAGAALLFGGRTGDAARVLADYRARLPDDARPPAYYYYCAGLAALAAGWAEEADGLVTEGLAGHEESAPLHLLAGNIAERRADPVVAERCYQRAAEEDPALAQAHRNLGDLAYRRGVRAEAMDHYRRAAEADPSLGDELFLRLGDLHHSRSERDEAIRCWRRAVTLNPGSEAARGRLEAVDRAGS